MCIRDRVTGAVRPHPSLLRPAVDPWARAAQLVRAAGDLLETHRAPDGTARSPDANILDTAAGRATCLARVGDLAGAVLAIEDTLALRAGQAHVTWPEVRRWLPGLAHLRRHAQTLTAAGDLHATVRLDDLTLIGAPIRVRSSRRTVACRSPAAVRVWAWRRSWPSPGSQRRTSGQVT